MIQKFYLNDPKNSQTLPLPPNPHDCLIKEILIEGEYLIFKFVDKLSHYDSINYLHPGVNSLIIKYHLIDESFSRMVKEKRKGSNKYKKYEISKLVGKYDYLEYLHHYVRVNEIMISLLDDWKHIDLYIVTDIIEYEWIYEEK